MQRYVLGFLFSPDRKYVLLMTKNRPDYQAGKLNGIGGKVEPTDACFMDAMRRECNEECGIDIEDWAPVSTKFGPDLCVHVYTAVADLSKARSLTDEPVAVFPVDSLENYHLFDDVLKLVRVSSHIKVLGIDY